MRWAAKAAKAAKEVADGRSRKSATVLQPASLLGEMGIFKVLHKCYTSSKVQHVVRKGADWATFAEHGGSRTRTSHKWMWDLWQL